MAGQRVHPELPSGACGAGKEGTAADCRDADQKTGVGADTAAGRILTRDWEYRKKGTANVFCGVEPRVGHTSPEPLRRVPHWSSPPAWWRSLRSIPMPAPSIW